MTDKKLTDSEIVKALEEQLNLMGYVTNGCYLDTAQSFQMYETLRVSLDLINRKDQENESLKAEVERLTVLADLGNMRANDYRVMRDRALKAEKEVERLGNAYKQCAWERDIFAEDMKEEIKKDCSYLMLDIKTIKTEAYKECIEKAKDLFPKEDWFTREAFDNLLKELVGEDK